MIRIKQVSGRKRLLLLWADRSFTPTGTIRWKGDMRNWVGILVLASTVAIGEEPAERLPDVGDPGAEA